MPQNSALAQQLSKVFSLPPPFEKLSRKHRSHKNRWARMRTHNSRHAAFCLIRVLTAVLLSAGMTVACDQAPQNKQAGAAAPPAVTVAYPLQKEITEWDEFTGRFEAVETVEIRSRVSGFLQSKHFNDGQKVSKGDLLFKIDPRPFEISLAQATAQLKQAAARLQLAKSDAARAKKLSRRGNISKQKLEESESQLLEKSASLEAAKARVREVNLNLEWSEVRSPITGRPSDARVDVGNLISGGPTNSTLLTTVVSLDPIHFIIIGSEADFLKYMRLDRAGKRISSRVAPNPVIVRLADETDFKHKGNMDFVDNAIDPRSGTIRARAIFPNPTGILTPGLFGHMRLFGGESEALLIPDTAIASDQARKIVQIAGEDGSIAPRIVTLGPMVDGLRVIRTGLKATDKIVIKGLQRIRPGQKVNAELGTIEMRPAKNN